MMRLELCKLHFLHGIGGRERYGEECSLERREHVQKAGKKENLVYLDNFFRPNVYFLVYNALLFNLFTTLCNYHHYLIPEHFHHPIKKLHNH